MRLWLPYIVGGSGTDTFTKAFAEQLRRAGHHGVLQPLPHALQFAPDVLKRTPIPPGVDATLTNSWNGFAFSRPGLPMITMEQLCVHDAAYREFRTRAQGVFHDSLVRWYEKRTFAAADRVVAVSEFTRRAVSREFPGTDPVVVPNGVDIEFFHPSGGRGRAFEDGPFRILFVGNLTRRKGADLLPQVMRLLGSDFQLSYTSGLRERAQLEVANAVNLGALDRVGVLQAYREADLFLFPTRLEGLPLSVLEAMACGLPIVGSDRTSMPEVVEHGVTGLLVPLDPGALAEAVRIIAADDRLRTAMASASRTRVVAAFSMSRTVGNYLRLFADLGAA